MAAEGKKGEPQKQITEKQRFTFIGFDVFPGTPKDLFKSDAEKSKHVEAVKLKREKGDVIRDECKLLEERVSSFDRIVLTLACLLIIGTLAVPWFTTYNEFVEEEKSEPVSAVVSPTAMADSTLMAMGDSVNTAATQAMDSTALAAATNNGTPLETGMQNETPGEEVLHSYIARKKVRKEYASMAGYKALISIGSAGGYLFGSGIVLKVTGVLFILFLVVCIGLPAYTLYGIYGMKGNADQQALALKKVLKLNWIPVVLFMLSFILSFFGAQYGFDSQAVFTSLGTSYGPGVFLGSLSYGVVVALGAFILTALKGVEI